MIPLFICTISILDWFIVDGVIFFVIVVQLVADDFLTPLVISGLLFFEVLFKEIRINKPIMIHS